MSVFTWEWEVTGEAGVTESFSWLSWQPGHGGRESSSCSYPAGISDCPLVSLDSSVRGPRLPAGTPFVNPGLVPRELSGIPAAV